MLLPNSWGTSRERSRGEERRCTPCQHPSIGIIPTGGQKRWARTRSERGEPQRDSPHGAGASQGSQAPKP